MAKNQAATNPNPRPLMIALVDRGRASRWFSRPEGRNSSVARDDCRPAEYNVRPVEARLSTLGGIGITHRIVGRWAIFLLERGPPVSSYRTVTGRVAQRPIWCGAAVKGESPSIWGILSSRLKLLHYTPTNLISPSDFKSVPVCTAPPTPQTNVFLAIRGLFPLAHLP